MNPKTLIILGAAVSLALASLGIIWVPYGDTGTPEASNNHFAALVMTLLDVLAVFLFAALRGSQGNRAYSGIIASYFLSVNALLTVGLFARTYFGLNYGIFWGSQGLQWAAVIVLWFAGNHVGQLSGERAAKATIAGSRKDSLIDELENMRRCFPAGDDAARKVLTSLATKLVEELRYFPNQDISVTAGNPFGRVSRWRIAAEAYLGAPTTNEAASSAPHELVVEAGSIISALAGYRRQPSHEHSTARQ